MENRNTEYLKECLTSGIGLLKNMLPVLVGNPSLLTVDQVIELRQLLSEGYSTIDDYWQRHLDSEF